MRWIFVGFAVVSLIGWIAKRLLAARPTRRVKTRPYPSTFTLPTEIGPTPRLEILPDGVEILHRPDIDELPVGIEVLIAPEPVIGQPEGGDKWPFVWRYTTSVKTIDRPLTVIEFGAMHLVDERWVIPTRPTVYDAGISGIEDFAKWYRCPEGRLEPGVPTFDSTGWTGSWTPDGFAQKHFFVGIDADGNRFQGMKVIEFPAIR